MLPLPSNRSMPDSAVIPVLHYPEVPQAVAWLCRAFGFSERLRIGTHRVQLQVAAGMGALVVAQGPSPRTRGTSPGVALMVRVADAGAHHAAAQAAGAEITQPPSSHPYGERQYSAADPGGCVWTFSQTIADVDPGSWGGTWMGANSSGA